MTISDDLLPALRELLGPGSRAVVATAVHAAGGELDTLERRQVLYRPGRRASVRFAATVRWGGGAPVVETIVAIVDVAGPPDGTLVLTAGPMAVGLFRYPDDPALPGLRPAVVAPAVAARLGVSADDVRLDVRTYRPGRRAVVRVRIGDHDTAVGARDVAAPAAATERYLKVVPPAELGALVARLRGLDGHLPVPRVLATWDDEGTAVLEAMPGRTIRDVLLAGDRRAVDGLPDGRAILDLLERMPVVTDGSGGPSGGSRDGTAVDGGPVSRAAAHATLLAAVLPDEAARLAALVARIGEVRDDGPVVATHADLHEAQLLVDGDRVTGVIDVDGATAGRRAHDLGTLLGHLVGLGVAMPRRRAAIDRWRARLEPAFTDAVGPDVLRRTTAAALVGLATGPFRVQQPDWRRRVRRRLDAAEAWAGAA